MRKIALILSLLMLFGMTVVSAEIGRGRDDFDGSTWITSGTSIDSNGKWIGFQRKTTNTEREYYISFSSKSLNYIKFSKESAEIKIDDNPVQKIAVKEVSSSPSVTNSKLSFIDVKVVLPIEIIQQIKTANRIAIKFHRENSVPDTLVLPDPVLAEWQQVINTEK